MFVYVRLDNPQASYFVVIQLSIPVFTLVSTRLSDLAGVVLIQTALAEAAQQHCLSAGSRLLLRYYYVLYYIVCSMECIVHGIIGVCPTLGFTLVLQLAST